MWLEHSAWILESDLIWLLLAPTPFPPSPPTSVPPPFLPAFLSVPLPFAPLLPCPSPSFLLVSWEGQEGC